MKGRRGSVPLSLGGLLKSDGGESVSLFYIYEDWMIPSSCFRGLGTVGVAGVHGSI